LRNVIKYGQDLAKLLPIQKLHTRWPEKLSHYEESSWNRIRIRNSG